MLTIRCKSCGKELVSHPTKLKSCGCPNLTSIRGTNISGNNLQLVEIVEGAKVNKTNNVLTPEDLRYQEQRKQRKVRRIEFEER